MPVYSMTGFGSAQGALGISELALELRSVNGRFLDLSLRLPDEWRQHEATLREQVSARLKRGKVELRLQVNGATGARVTPPAPALLQQLLGAQDAVLAWLPQAQPLSVAQVLDWANRNPSSGDASAQAPALSELCERALIQLLQAREREGERTTQLLLAHTAQLQTLAAQAAPLLPPVIAAQQSRFLERWAAALALAGGEASAEDARQRALAEAAAFALRIDVAEELARLGSHLDEIARVLRAGGAVGKRLDFLIQELHREANTLGAKSATLELSRISMEMKVLIEQMREQVQNLE